MKTASVEKFLAEASFEGVSNNYVKKLQYKPATISVFIYSYLACQCLQL